MAKLEPKASKAIPEGKHEGEIMSSLRKIPGESDEKGNVYKYDYTDYEIKLTSVDGQPSIKVGFPTDVSFDGVSKRATTKHGKFLENLGVDITKGFDTDDVVGMKVSLTTENEETERGTFARVIGKVKPLN